MNTLTLVNDNLATLLGDPVHARQVRALCVVLGLVALGGPVPQAVDDALTELRDLGRTATPDEWDHLCKLASGVLAPPSAPLPVNPAPLAARPARRAIQPAESPDVPVPKPFEL